MAASIPEEILTEIRHAADIVEIVSEAVQLRKSGRNYMGLCPFHAEKTPSFTVNADKGIFHCFGCGVGGNVFSFLMQHAGMSFPEAARALAERYGIALPQAELTAEERQRQDEREHLLAVHRAAATFFRQCLRSGGEGRVAREYLRRRNLSEQTLECFGIGFAPPGWERVISYLARNGFAPELAVHAGLATPRGQGREGHYDRFRNRIIFPIESASREVIAFGGRVMDSSLPKYLNSPETALFSKRRALYGLSQARGRCRSTRQVLVVEGYIDVLALHQAGFENAVATLGTALTAEHVKALRALVGAEGRIVLVFDADAAGIAAAERSVPIFQQGRAEARILMLPAGHDPDTFVAERGADAFAVLLDKTQELMPFLLDAAIQHYGLTVEGKLRIVDSLLPSLAAMDDPLRRGLHLRQIAERLAVQEQALMARLRSMSRDPHPDGILRPAPHSARMKADLSAAPAVDPFEKRIVAMMLQFPDILPEIVRRNIPEMLHSESLKAIAECVLSLEGAETDLVSRVIARLEREELQRLTASLAVGSETWERRGCLKLMDQFVRRRRDEGQSLVRRIAAAEKDQDSELLMRLLRDQQNQARKEIQQRKREFGTVRASESPLS